MRDGAGELMASLTRNIAEGSEHRDIDMVEKSQSFAKVINFAYVENLNCARSDCHFDA